MCIKRWKRLKIAAWSILFSTGISLKHKLCGSVFGLSRHYWPLQDFGDAAAQHALQSISCLRVPRSALPTQPGSWHCPGNSHCSTNPRSLGSTLHCPSPLVSLFSAVSYLCKPPPSSRPWHTAAPLIPSRWHCFLLCPESWRRQPYAATRLTSSSLRLSCCSWVLYFRWWPHCPPKSPSLWKGNHLPPSPILNHWCFSSPSQIHPQFGSSFLLTLTYNVLISFQKTAAIVFSGSPCIRFFFPLQIQAFLLIPNQMFTTTALTSLCSDAQGKI